MDCTIYAYSSIVNKALVVNKWMIAWLQDADIVVLDALVERGDSNQHHVFPGPISINYSWSKSYNMQMIAIWSRWHEKCVSWLNGEFWHLSRGGQSRTDFLLFSQP